MTDTQPAGTPAPEPLLPGELFAEFAAAVERGMAEVREAYVAACRAITDAQSVPAGAPAAEPATRRCITCSGPIVDRSGTARWSHLADGYDDFAGPHPATPEPSTPPAQPPRHFDDGDPAPVPPEDPDEPAQPPGERRAAEREHVVANAVAFEVYGADGRPSSPAGDTLAIRVTDDERETAYRAARRVLSHLAEFDAESTGERRAAAGPPPGTLDGPGVLGRALLDRRRRVWLSAGEPDGTYWTLGAAQGWWTVEAIEEDAGGPVREVLLVDPAEWDRRERLADVARQWREWDRVYAVQDTAGPLAALAAAVDALDRPTTGGPDPQRDLAAGGNEPREPADPLASAERCTVLTRHTDINGDDMVPCDNPLPCSWHPGEIPEPSPDAETQMDAGIAEFAALPDCEHCDGTGKQVPEGWYERRREGERWAARLLAPLVDAWHRSRGLPTQEERDQALRDALREDAEVDALQRDEEHTEPAPEPAGKLHAELRHPSYEYVTTTGPRKAWDAADTPPSGGGWERNVWYGSTDGAPGEGWERLDHVEHSYWMRRAEPAPEPAGDGPGWDRDIVEHLAEWVATGVGWPTVISARQGGDQLFALLADRDHQYERRFALNQLLAEAWEQRDAARAELAEVTARLGDRDRALKVEMEISNQLRAELATARRDAAADALEWVAWCARVRAHRELAEHLEKATAEVRAGTRPVPGSPQPAPDGGKEASSDAR